MRNSIIVKKRINTKDNTIVFDNVYFSSDKRGIDVIYKQWGGTLELAVWIDGTPIAIVAINSSAQYEDYNKTSAELPKINAGKHEVKIVLCDHSDCYIDELIFTEESPYDRKKYTVGDYSYRKTNNDLITATDELGRKLPDNVPLREDKLVGIFYWTWRNQSIFSKPISLEEVLKVAPEAEYDIDHPIWTKRDMVHWKEPLYGYYRNDDPYVIRKHAQYFADAGVDVLVFDTTNGSLVWKDSFMALLKELRKCRDDGICTPQVAFMMNFGPAHSTLDMLRGVYQELYKPGLYEDLWFKWNSKPLVMAYPESIPEKGISDFDTALLNEIREFFTFRPGQPLYEGGPTRNDQWGWLENAPQNGYVKKPDGTFEMCTVGVAQNSRAGRLCTHFNDHDTFGRSYTFKDKHSKLTEESYKYGYNVQEQWDRAMEIDPDYVFVTGWNEWMMGKFPGKPWVADESSTQIAFVDQYDRERSRDIEPARTGHKDSYYLQLAANIRRYKGIEHVDHSWMNKTIDISREDSWQDVKPEYISHKGTKARRDHPGLGEEYYRNVSGMNNIISCKGAYDNENLYFMAMCAEDILSHTNECMTLLIDSDRNKDTGWEGYDYRINKGMVYEWKDGKWEELVACEYNYNGAFITVSIPRTLLGGSNEFEFKWIDGIKLTDPMNFYTDGDCAPFGRFNYVASI